MSRKSYAEHSFYCLACGNKGIPLARQQSHKHKGMHRKKLYCIHCQTEVNHVECQTLTEVEAFKRNFEKGVYKNEAEESLLACRSSCVR